MRSHALLLCIGLAVAAGGRAAVASDASQLAAACASCHATAGDAGAIPRIAGSDQSLIEFSMLAYRSGQRESQAMRIVANALSLDEITAVARYLSKQELARR